MTAMVNIGNFIVALPPSDIQSTYDQAAEFLSYEKEYFKASIICLNGFPKPKYITETAKGRRWNLIKLSNWLEGRPEDLKKAVGRPRKIQRGFS